MKDFRFYVYDDKNRNEEVVISVEYESMANDVRFRADAQMWLKRWFDAVEVLDEEQQEEREERDRQFHYFVSVRYCLNNSNEVTRAQLINHGREHEQYFQGCGTAFTTFDNVVTGIGDDANEAYDDALEMLAQSGGKMPKEIDELLKHDIS
jgi:hypothetical protein